MTALGVFVTMFVSVTESSVGSSNGKHSYQRSGVRSGGPATSARTFEAGGTDHGRIEYGAPPSLNENAADDEQAFQDRLRLADELLAEFDAVAEDSVGLSDSAELIRRIRDERIEQICPSVRGRTTQ